MTGQLQYRRASFETLPSRAPQDEDFSLRHETILILRCAAQRSLEGRIVVIQP